MPREGVPVSYTIFGRSLGLVTLWAAVLSARAYYVRSSAELSPCTGLCSEIASRMQTERELLERTERFERVLSGVRDAIWDLGCDGPAHLFVIPLEAHPRLLNEDEVGDSENEWLSRIHPDDHPA